MFLEKETTSLNLVMKHFGTSPAPLEWLYPRCNRDSRTKNMKGTSLLDTALNTPLLVYKIFPVSVGIFSSQLLFINALNRCLHSNSSSNSLRLNQQPYKSSDKHCNGDLFKIRGELETRPGQITGQLIIMEQSYINTVNNA